MKFLFDSTGQHIANEINGQLHATTGQNIGHLLPTGDFYIDMQGYYLGEVIFENRLIYRINNGFENVCYGSYGDYGNMGNYGNPGNFGSIGIVPGFRDIDTSKLNR